jgi:hypothetical protein
VQSTSGSKGIGAPLQKDRAIFDSTSFGQSGALRDPGVGIPQSLSMGIDLPPESSSLFTLGLDVSLVGLNAVRLCRL